MRIALAAAISTATVRRVLDTERTSAGESWRRTHASQWTAAWRSACCCTRYMKRPIAACLLLAAIASLGGCITEEETEPTDECYGLFCGPDEGAGEDEPASDPDRDPEDDCYGWICGLGDDR